MLPTPPRLPTSAGQDVSSGVHGMQPLPLSVWLIHKFTGPGLPLQHNDQLPFPELSVLCISHHLYPYVHHENAYKLGIDQHNLTYMCRIISSSSLTVQSGLCPPFWIDCDVAVVMWLDAGPWLVCWGRGLPLGHWDPLKPFFDNNMKPGPPWKFFFSKRLERSINQVLSTKPEPTYDIMAFTTSCTKS